jgi:VanZ family protein
MRVPATSSPTRTKSAICKAILAKDSLKWVNPSALWQRHYHPAVFSCITKPKSTEVKRSVKARLATRIFSVAVLAAVVITALGPAKWQPRTMLGWEIDHFIGYFWITFLVCLAWPRPWLVSFTMITFALILEGLQALTPDRSPNLLAVFYSACGIIVASLLVRILMRGRWRELF